MDWQQPASLAVVALTGYFFIRHEIRIRRKSRPGACAPDCACGAGESHGPASGTALLKTGDSGEMPGRERGAS